MRIRYLKQEKNRHGKPRLYVRIPGRKLVRLPVDSIEDPSFGPAYAAALNGEPVPAAGRQTKSKPGKAIPGSMRELSARYSEFLAKDTTLSERTKYTRRRHLEEVCPEPAKAPTGAQLTIGDMPASKMTTAMVQKILDRKRATPEAANDRRKALMAMFKWAAPRGFVPGNPAERTEKIRTNSEGFATWGEEQFVRFVQTHPLGTKPYLALVLLYCTGQRRGDVVRFGRQHVKDGALNFTQQKNEKRAHKQMRIPILPQLQEALDLVPKDQMIFLVTEFGKPFTAAGFGNWFRDKCDQAGLKGFSAHGLRKALQTMGADLGLSDRELMAIAGHETTAMTAIYTKRRDRARLAASGMSKLSNLQIGAPGTGFDQSAPDRPEK